MIFSIIIIIIILKVNFSIFTVVFLMATLVASDFHPTYLSRHLKNKLSEMMMGRKVIFHHKKTAFKNKGTSFVLISSSYNKKI